jgi:hypothetical protein
VWLLLGVGRYRRDARELQHVHDEQRLREPHRNPHLPLRLLRGQLMKLSNYQRLAVLAAGLAVAAGAFLACSSDNSNPIPVNVFDSGQNTQDANVQPGQDANVQPGQDANIQPGQDANVSQDGNVTPSDASLLDTNLPDVGTCTSDASTCNSCYTPAQDPLNGCSPATVNCIPFDNSRVPSGAP